MIFSQKSDTQQAYVENFSGTKLERPTLNRLLDEAQPTDILLVESVDRLSRLSQDDFSTLKQRIKAKGLERSGYKPTGKKADIAKHDRIIELNNKGLTKEEIAKAVGCGVATVYRVIKGM